MLRPDNFEATLKDAEKPVLVKFGATWCYPCRSFTPVVAAVVLKLAKRVDAYAFDVDADKSAKVTGKLKILSIPSLVIFKKGRERARLTGAVSEDAVRQFILRAVPAKKRKV